MNKKYYEILGRLSEMKVLPKAREEYSAYVNKFRTLQRLAKKHHKLAEYDCNGEGIVAGRFYRCDGSMPRAYVKEDVTIFMDESDKLEERIKALAEELKFNVEFQGDPRGATVKIRIRNTHIDLTDILWA